MIKLNDPCEQCNKLQYTLVKRQTEIIALKSENDKNNHILRENVCRINELEKLNSKYKNESNIIQNLYTEMRKRRDEIEAICKQHTEERDRAEEQCARAKEKKKLFENRLDAKISWTSDRSTLRENMLELKDSNNKLSEEVRTNLSWVRTCGEVYLLSVLTEFLYCMYTLFF